MGKRHSGRFHVGATRFAVVGAVVLATVLGLAHAAGANTGHAFATQTCYTWSASVTLDNNVKPDFFVEVTSTIPGTTGLVDAHFDTMKNSGTQLIWQASGAAPSSGTVTLTILYPDRSLDSTASATLPPAPRCETTTTAPPETTTVVPETVPTTTAAPTTAPPTVPETTTTAAPPTTETIPATIVITTTTPTTPVTKQGGPPSSVTTTTNITVQGATTTSVATGRGTATLPRTGTGALFPILFGASCAGGGALIAVRRRHWTRS